VRILPTEIQVSHLMTLAHRRLGKAEVERIRTALRTFSDESPEGRKFFTETGYLGYEPVTAGDIANLKPYVELTRRMIGVAD
jgi:phosphonate transport system substrate-binding protein